jgi:hypothetical protein
MWGQALDLPAMESLFQPNVPVQRRRYAVRWNRLFADSFFVSLSRKHSKTFVPRSSEVETVKLHDFVPGRYKVLHELLPGVLASVDFRQGPELGV